jgi:uncharacterized protein YfaS (alpha-2-macroglobulin family)
MSCEYYEGDTVLLRVTVRDTDGELVAATTTLTVEDPSGTITTPAVSNPSLGVYQASVLLDEAGWWSYRWEATTTEGTKICEGRVCPCASALTGVVS